MPNDLCYTSTSINLFIYMEYSNKICNCIRKYNAEFFENLEKKSQNYIGTLSFFTWADVIQSEPQK